MPGPCNFALFQLKIPRQQQFQAGIRVGHQPLGLVQNRFFQGIARHTAVAVGGSVLDLLAVKVGHQRQLAGIVQCVALAFGNRAQNLIQLLARVIRELDLVREAAGKAGVRAQKQLHLLRVARRRGDPQCP